MSYLHFISIIDFKFCIQQKRILARCHIKILFLKRVEREISTSNEYFLNYSHWLFQMLWVYIVWLILFGVSGQKCFRHRTKQQSPTSVHSSTATSSISQLLHLPMFHLTSAKIKNINISSTLLLSPGKCLDSDWTTENAKSHFYGKNKDGKDCWLQIYVGKIFFF